MAITKKDFLSVHIPKRQYIGESKVLDKKINNIILDEIKKAYKKLNLK